MRVCIAGINYGATLVAIREKLTISSSQLQNALLLLHNYVPQGVILSTCNRIEVYTLADEASSPEPAAINFLKAWSNLSDAELLPLIYFHQGEAAIKYLFCIASGLNSMIIGEFEILGQLSQALEAAKKVHLAGLPLLSLFHQAVGVGRRVRAETGISRNALSIGSVAVELAAAIVGDISNCRVLVIGAGEAGRLVAKAVKGRGGKQITVASRSLERASSLAKTLGGNSVSLDNLSQELTMSDIAISGTAAPHLILRPPIVKKTMSERPNRPLVIIDIAVPRDVDPEVKQIDNVFLYDINDFDNIVELNREQRENEMQAAMKIVDDEAERFISRWRAYEVRPVITALVTKAENVRQAQFNETIKKLPGISDEERASLESMTKSIVQKILHEPIRCLKRTTRKEGDYTQVVNELFHLDKERIN